MNRPNIDVDIAAECARLLDKMRSRIEGYEMYRDEMYREEAIMYGTAVTAILGLEHFRA